MPLRLSRPDLRTHREDLRDRLRTQVGPAGPEAAEALVERLVAVVADMDQGAITTREAFEVFMRHRDRVPGFSFVRWLVDMIDEGIYLDGPPREAAPRPRPRPGSRVEEMAGR